MRSTIAFLLLAATMIPFNSPAQADAASAPQPPQPKEWTFLVYLNGNNNLDSFGSQNINQMEQVGSSKDLNIVVQWASLANKTTKRLYVKKDSDANNVTSPVIQDVGNVDMGDYHSLVDFVRWGVKNYPAKHYFIDVWDHGSGWHAIQAMGHSYRPMDISWDDNTGHSITTQQLGEALRESAAVIGHKIDLYASDACLMAMAEVANEVADSVSVYAGSQETEPGAGWPYDSFLKDWAAKPLASPAEVATYLTTEYVKSYSGGENGTEGATFSAFDLSAMPKLDQAVGDFARGVTALSTGDRAKVLDAAKNSQAFAYSDYVDLSDFLGLVQKANVASIRQSTFVDIRSALSDFVITAAATTDYSKAKGVSIWLPTDSYSYSQYSSLYEQMKFEQSTHWGDALKVLSQDASRLN